MILDEPVQEPEEPPVTPPAPEPVIKTVIAYLLHVRRGPGTENEIVGYLPYGTKVEIFETATASNGGLWGRIATGWIYMGYTE